MSEDKQPVFVHEEGHEWTQGEKIYVLDRNKFDIYEAEIKEIKQIKNKNEYSIHYPEYPDDDFVAKTTTRFLVQNEANKKIFEEQEAVRRKKDEEEAVSYTHLTLPTM